jgi:hypothetical protein
MVAHKFPVLPEWQDRYIILLIHGMRRKLPRNIAAMCISLGFVSTLTANGKRPPDLVE